MRTEDGTQHVPWAVVGRQIGRRVEQHPHAVNARRKAAELAPKVWRKGNSERVEEVRLLHLYAEALDRGESPDWHPYN